MEKATLKRICTGYQQPTFISGADAGNLLVRYQLKPILTEAENDAALSHAQKLEHRLQRTSEEDSF